MVLSVEALTVRGLPPLSFAVEAGECFAIEGPSGSGKTLLLRALADLDPAPGRVGLDGADRSSIPAPLWRQKVRYLAAEPAWWEPTARAHFNEAPATRTLAAVRLEPATLDREIGRAHV